MSQATSCSNRARACLEFLYAAQFLGGHGTEFHWGLSTTPSGSAAGENIIGLVPVPNHDMINVQSFLYTVPSLIKHLLVFISDILDFLIWNLLGPQLDSSC